MQKDKRCKWLIIREIGEVTKNYKPKSKISLQTEILTFLA